MSPMETSKVNPLPAAESSGSILEHPSLNCRGDLALEDLPQGESGAGWSGESLTALNQGWDASSLHAEKKFWRLAATSNLTYACCHSTLPLVISGPYLMQTAQSHIWFSLLAYLEVLVNKDISQSQGY